MNDAPRHSGSHDLAHDLLDCGSAFLLLLSCCCPVFLLSFAVFLLSAQSWLLLQAWQLMFDSVDTANDCIRIATGVLSTIKINPKKMLAGLSPDMLATDLAEYLVRKGALHAGVSFQLHISPCCGRILWGQSGGSPALYLLCLAACAQASCLYLSHCY